jgi:site-specific DNA recombinase
MLNNDIDSSDFRLIKEQCNEKINRLEAQLNHLTAENAVILDTRPIAKQAIEGLRQLDKFYENAGVEGKRYLVGMLYPEKLTYSEEECRTTKMNEAAELIYLKNKKLQAKKKGQKSLLKTLPHKGWNMGLEPTTLGTTNRCSNQLS